MESPISKSRLFLCILKKVSNGKIKEPFRVKDVMDCLNTSKPFLTKHCTDPKDKKKKATGNAYFIRVSRGLYEINPKYKPTHNST